MIRKTGVWNDNGQYVTQEVQTDIPAIVQPYRRTQTGSQIILPEGLSSEDTLVIWTTTQLRSSNEYASAPADVILYNDLRYEIQDVSEWEGYSSRLINQHYECLAVLETKRG